MLSIKESLAEKFVKKGFWLYIFTFLIGPLGYLIKVMISRDLSVEEVGMFYGVISFVVFLSMYNDFGCTESMSYFLPNYLVKKEYGKAKYILSLVVLSQMTTSILIFIILFFLAPWLSLFYFKVEVTELLRIAGLFFIGINIMHISTTLFTAVQDTKLQKGSELMRLIGTSIGVLVLFFGEFGDIQKYMIIWIGGLIIGILFSSYHAIKKYYIPYFLKVPIEKDIKLRNTFFRYALATLFTANIGMVLSQIDMQLIIYLLGPEDVGYYTTYLSLIGIPFLLITPIVSFLFPVISELSGRKEEYKIQALIEKFWRYFGIIGIWTSIFLFQFSENISVFLFGEKFRESGQILAYSALFIIFNILIQISFQVLAGTGQIKKRLHILLITLVINIPLNIILIDMLGTKGSALAVGISWIPLYFMSVRATGLSLPIFGDIFWYKNLLGSIIAYFSYYFIENYFDTFPYFLDIILAILLYMIIFMALNRGLIFEAIDTIKKVRKKKTSSIESPTPLSL